MYTCEKCTKNFKKNYLLIRHQNKKNPCNNVNNINNIHINKIKNIENEINIKTQGSLEKENICLFCDLEFTLKGNLNKHIKKYLICLINDKNSIYNRYYWSRWFLFG